MAKIPKYVLRLLERRASLASTLIGINTELVNYCNKIGIEDMDKACVCSDFRIYTEPWAAERITISAIAEQLSRRESNEGD